MICCLLLGFLVKFLEYLRNVDSGRFSELRTMWDHHIFRERGVGGEVVIGIVRVVVGFVF